MITASTSIGRPGRCRASERSHRASANWKVKVCRNGPARSHREMSEPQNDCDSAIELDISEPGLTIRNAAIWLYTPAFEEFTPSGVPAPGRDADVVAVGDPVDAAANQPAGGSAAHNWGEFSLLSEGGDPFAGASRILIDQEDRTPVEWHRAEPFGEDAHRVIAKTEVSSRSRTAFCDAIRSKVARVSFEWLVSARARVTL